MVCLLLSCCLLYTSCVRCAPALVEAGADRFAVATLEEGVQLRETGVTTPIHCLGYLPVSYTHLDVYKRQPYG